MKLLMFLSLVFSTMSGLAATAPGNCFSYLSEPSSSCSYQSTTEDFIDASDNLNVYFGRMKSAVGSEAWPSFIETFEGENDSEISEMLIGYNINEDSLKTFLSEVAIKRQVCIDELISEYSISEELAQDSFVARIEYVLRPYPTDETCRGIYEKCMRTSRNNYTIGITACYGIGLGITALTGGIFGWVGLAAGVACIAAVADNYQIAKDDCTEAYNACI